MDQYLVLATIAVVLILFIVDKIRYDIVALIALIFLTATRVIPAGQAFSGFSHPAVITVAAVLVIGQGLLNSGLVDVITDLVNKVGNKITVQVFILCSMVAVCSAFINNVGALALFMPVAIRVAKKSERSPSIFLMPIAFASLLGGMTTLIGTPPNIIISSFRSESLGKAPFNMFDFTLVGAGVAILGIIFISLIGWRLIPVRKGNTGDFFEINDYITEVILEEDSKAIGKCVYEFEDFSEGDVLVVGSIRGNEKIVAPNPFRKLQSGDIVIIRSSADALASLIDKAKVKLLADKKISFGDEDLKQDDISIAEAVVMNTSPMIDRTARSLRLRYRYGVNLIAVSRQGELLRQRLNNIRLKAGDILLLQGRDETLNEIIPVLGCLPLAERPIKIGYPKRLVLALSIFFSAITLATLGFVTFPVAFIGGAILMVLLELISLEEIYKSIDWSVIVLLGAMIPVSTAFETTGGAEMISQAFLYFAPFLPDWGLLAGLLVATMILSDIVNNAAAAVLMAPIGIQVAQGMNYSEDPFLMAVAIGASCAFLTPIGHQSNTLILGPGGYKFKDYWPMGLPLEILILLAGVPMLMFFWPLS
jgi:di/tricarboxylate transporter